MVRAGYDELRRGDPPAGVASRAFGLLDDDPDYQPATVLLSQTLYLQGRAREAANRLAPIVELLPDYVPAALLHARALEETGDVVAAYRAYVDLAEIQLVAARQATTLADPALDVLHRRFDDAMSRGHLEESEEILENLALWAPDAARTLESRRRFQVTTSDAEGELDTLRRLLEVDPTPERQLRTGILELEVGDLRSGLESLETLDPESLVEPADRDQLSQALERGRFLRRLDLLPVQVRGIAELGELSRADLASLVYWLFPSVRFAPLENPPIAADILDHPYRQEILKVAGQEVMEVDETLHRFFPNRSATRSETFSALLGLLLDGEPRPACLGDVTEIKDSSAWICDRAVRCRLMEDVGGCLPSAALSGKEALVFFQRGLAQLGGPEPVESLADS
ncbi:MAG: hypothetical protein MPN21_17945 [Thermoanaerobaculia bacterium]|nr:hypothetical protein [Thermoanaerobaculia bacterium]